MAQSFVRKLLLGLFRVEYHRIEPPALPDTFYRYRLPCTVLYLNKISYSVHSLRWSRVHASTETGGLSSLYYNVKVALHCLPYLKTKLTVSTTILLFRTVKNPKYISSQLQSWEATLSDLVQLGA